MNQRYFIELTDEERQHLEKLTSSGIAPARSVTRAHILLKSDSSAAGPNWKYEQICAAFNVSPVTVMNVRKSSLKKGWRQPSPAKGQTESTNMRWMAKRKRI